MKKQIAFLFFTIFLFSFPLFCYSSIWEDIEPAVISSMNAVSAAGRRPSLEIHNNNGEYAAIVYSNPGNSTTCGLPPKYALFSIYMRDPWGSASYCSYYSDGSHDSVIDIFYANAWPGKWYGDPYNGSGPWWLYTYVSNTYHTPIPGNSPPFNGSTVIYLMQDAQWTANNFDPTKLKYYGSQAHYDCMDKPTFTAYSSSFTGSDSYNADMNAGRSKCPDPMVGNPVNTTNGNKYQEDVDFDYSIPGSDLKFVRYYNSTLGNTVVDGNAAEYYGPFGSYKWSNNYNILIVNPTASTVNVKIPGGEFLYFGKPQSGNIYSQLTNADYSLVSDATGYNLTHKDGTTYRFDLSGKMTSITDEKDNVTSVNTVGNVTTITDPFGRQIKIYYDINGFIDHVVDPYNKTYSYIYESAGGVSHLKSVIYPDLKSVNYGYTNTSFPHHLTSRTDENNHTKSWGYDSSGRANSIDNAGLESLSLDYNGTPGQTTVTARGNQKAYTYHKNSGGKNLLDSTGCSTCGAEQYTYYTGGATSFNNISTAIDRRGNITRYSNYDTKGNPGLIFEGYSTASQRTTRYAYHPATSEPTSITRKSALPFGNNSTSVREFVYDSNKRLVKSYSRGNTKDASGATQFFNYSSSFTYSSRAQKLSATDARGKRTTFDYYSTTWGNSNHGQLQTVTNHLGHTITYGNYSSGKAGWTKDANGILTKNIYDSRGRLVAVTAHNRTTRYGYDGFGNRTAMTLPRGNHVGYEYDGANRLVKVRDGRGNYISYSYDTEGNRTREEVHDASGILKKYQDMAYDNDNRLWKVKGFDGYSSVNNYDGNGNITATRDKKGNNVSYIYDALDRLSTVTQPGNITTGYTYDINDNVTLLTDGKNNTTGYIYDDMGRLVETNSPDTGLTRYEYDPAGNLLKKKDAKQIEVNYEYDALNRVTTIRFPADHTKDITYGYDSGANGIGRLTSMTDPSGTTAYYYDEYGSVIKEEKTFTGIPTQTTQYSYNDNGNLLSIRYPDGRIIHYEYDDADAVTRAWTEKPNTATKDLANSLTHMPFGGIASFTFGNGLTAQRSYDQDYKLTYLKSGPFIRRNYGYDPDGNITGITDLVNPAKSQGFGYDALNRLTSATGAWGSLSYLYDNVGNRTQKTLGTSVTTYSYPTNNNRLSSLSGAESASFSYDDNGNIASDGTLTFTYDLNNRLIQASEGGNVKGEYVYDGLGRRVKKTAGGVTTYFLYDLAGNLICELDGSGGFKTNRSYMESQPLARFDAGVQNPPNPSASPYDTSACLSWDGVAGAGYYVVCWGDTSGYYPNCGPNVTELSYCVDGLTPDRTWYFIVKAYDSGGNLIGQSDEVTATPEPKNPELPHYNYNSALGGQADCTMCHVQPGTFMQGFGVRTSIGLCYSCHSATGIAHDKPYRAGHPVYVSVTTDVGHRLPTLGTFTGVGSDKTYTHLLNGRQVVCMTCHNAKAKPNDPGRSWEYTTTADDRTYYMQNGGWDYNAYLKPVVYRDMALWSGPTYTKDRKSYIVPEGEYDVYPTDGKIVFHITQPAGIYIYVTLGNDYLRNTNVINQLCLDCHIISTHKGADCTICHGTHNTSNLYNIREKVGTPRGYKEIEYRNVSGMSGNKGACVVCHSTTMYHNATAVAPLPHYDGSDCTICHTHQRGFPSFTTVLRTIVRRLFAFISGDVAYAGPPAWSGKNPTELPPGLQNHSVPEQAWENGLIRFSASVQVVRKPATTTATIKDDIITYYHNDHLGTPLFLSDETGAIVWRREQMPFGENTLLRGTVTENLRMPGQYWDAETGKADNGFRTYDSTIGRYIEPDPIGMKGGINLFEYAADNPLSYIDSKGLIAECKNNEPDPCAKQLMEDIAICESDAAVCYAKAGINLFKRGKCAFDNWECVRKARIKNIKCQSGIDLDEKQTKNYFRNNNILVSCF